MIERQHVWLGPEATTFDELCEACLSYRESDSESVAACPPCEFELHGRRRNGFTGNIDLSADTRGAA